LSKYLKKEDLRNAGFEISKNPAGKNQNPTLLNLGKATSFEPTWYGIRKLAKKPNTTGITT
jgi:hypothetical protein